MNQYEQQTNLLDDLTRCLGVDIANYSIEESTDIEDEERRTMLRSLVFSMMSSACLFRSDIDSHFLLGIVVVMYRSSYLVVSKLDEF